jgi:hypothetical protein
VEDLLAELFGEGRHGCTHPSQAREKDSGKNFGLLV